MIVKIGNIFESHAQVLVNTVNCVGVMGKGIAQEFKKRFPEMYNEYVYLCSIDSVKPGEPYLYSNMVTQSVLNFPTKDHWRSPSRLSYIINGLKWFREHYQEYQITSIAFPPLGCGNGGLEWKVVGPLMYKMLGDLPIDVEIFAPYGTPSEQLTIDYLKNHVVQTEELIGAKKQSINRYWYLILYVIQALNQDDYSLSVGRVIYQKICYVLTRAGIPTGFQFTKSSYGPYSSEVKKSITVLSNANLINEVVLGRMIETRVSPRFVLRQDAYTPSEWYAVKRTIDLLSRVKNTEQAEMLSTVLFAFDTLSQRGTNPSETEILDYVEQWKPHWKNNKHFDIISTIKALSELKWILPNYSHGYIDIEDDLF